MEKIVNAVQMQVKNLIEPLVCENDLFLEKVALTKTGKRVLLKITVDLIDTPGGVSSDKIAYISRKISKLLDEKQPISQAYTLEVSTPGAQRKVNTLRLWKRSVGLHIKFMYKGKSIQGKVEEIIDEEKVVISEQEYPIKEIENAETIIIF